MILADIRKVTKGSRSPGDFGAVKLELELFFSTLSFLSLSCEYCRVNG